MRIRIGTLCLLCVIGATEVAFSAEALTAGERTQVKGAALTPGKKCVKEDCTACLDPYACQYSQVPIFGMMVHGRFLRTDRWKGECVDKPDCNVSCASTATMCMWQAFHYIDGDGVVCGEDKPGDYQCLFLSCNGIQIGQCD